VCAGRGVCREGSGEGHGEGHMKCVYGEEARAVCIVDGEGECGR